MWPVRTKLFSPSLNCFLARPSNADRRKNEEGASLTASWQLGTEGFAFSKGCHRARRTQPAAEQTFHRGQVIILGSSCGVNPGHFPKGSTMRQIDHQLVMRTSCRSIVAVDVCKSWKTTEVGVQQANARRATAWRITHSRRKTDKSSSNPAGSRIKTQEGARGKKKVCSLGAGRGECREEI